MILNLLGLDRIPEDIIEEMSDQRMHILKKSWNSDVLVQQ